MDLLNTIRTEIKRLTDELYEKLPDAHLVEENNIPIEQAVILGKYMALESFEKFLDTLEAEERGKKPATIAFERLHGLNSKK